MVSRSANGALFAGLYIAVFRALGDSWPHLWVPALILFAVAFLLTDA